MNVLINGIYGKMGAEVAAALNAAADLQCTAGVDPKADPKGADSHRIPIYQNLEDALQAVTVDAVVDFTTPAAVKGNIELCLRHNVPVIVGTTGLSREDLADLEQRAEGRQWAALIVPNFALGAVLMMKFAAEAAAHFPDAEIIEYHHAQKLDAPSGTALQTAALIEQARKKTGTAWQSGRDHSEAARGSVAGATPIHSVRLPGHVAHQEVVFGGAGQRLVIRHDTTDRSCFMPGVLLALRRITGLQGIVVGLDSLLFAQGKEQMP